MVLSKEQKNLLFSYNDQLNYLIFVYIIDSDCKLLAWYCSVKLSVMCCDCTQI